MKQNSERIIGIHARITDSLLALARRAIHLNIPIFQIFLMDQTTRRMFTFTQDEIAQFRILREAHFGRLYLHGSYLVNLAGIHYNGIQILYKEISLAKQLGFTDVVLHPGSAHGAKNRMVGVDMVAKILNRIMRNEKSLTFILENTAHENMSVGSDISDFHHTRQKLDAPELVQFCIDTSHAHVYGYDIIDPIKKEKFITLLDESIGLHNISLIHLNDTDKERGSRIDKHSPIGKGVIGTQALKAFVMDTRFINTPIIMELPLMDDEQEQFYITMIHNWHNVV
jgi:deoxyribonuclease IV